MKTTYKIEAKNIISHFIKIIYVVIGIVAFIIFMAIQYPNESILSLTFLSIGVFGVILFPSIWLFISYYSQNKGDKLQIDGTTFRAIYKHKSSEFDFGFDEIESFETYLTPGLARNSPGWLPWDNYNYAVISLKNGERFILTSLITNELSLPIENKKIEVHKVLYPYLRRIDVKERRQKKESEFPDIYVRNLKDKKLNEIEDIIQSPNGYDKKFILAAKHELERRKRSN